MPRYFNQDIVSSLNGSKSIDISPLLKYSFVRPTERGYVLHELLRDYLTAQLRRVSPDRWGRLNQAALNYFLEKTKDAHDLTADWVVAATKSAYHQLNLSETVGVEYCLSLFARAESLYDVRLAVSIVKELEKFPFKDLGLSQWYRILYVRYEYIMKRNWKKASEEYSELLNYVNNSTMKVVILNGLALVLVELNRLDEVDYMLSKP